MARKHRATGRKPPGGKRDGAGRPLGSKNALDLGDVAALKALRLRVPEGASEPIAMVADQAFAQIVNVMRGQVSNFHGHATAVLKASTALREEVCGPVKQRIEHSFGDMTDEQLEARYLALAPKVAENFPREAGPTASAVPIAGADNGLEGDS